LLSNRSRAALNDATPSTIHVHSGRTCRSSSRPVGVSLPLGNDALAVLRRADKSGAEELERRADLARSTDFDGLAASDVDPAVLKLNSA
jgi:hypothetical protein